MLNIVKICKIHGELTEKEVGKHHKKIKGKVLKFPYVGAKCLKCANIATLKWQRKNSDKVKQYKRKTQYKLSNEDYEVLVKIQNNKCAICLQPETAFNNKTNEINYLSVDHCHKTKKIRGLLCGKCNVGIGMFKESEDLLQSASNYIRRHRL